MRYSLNKRIFLMFSMILIVIFSTLQIGNSLFLGKFYSNHKREQVIKVAEELKKSNYENIRDVGEKNNLKIDILEKNKLKIELRRFSNGPFSRFDDDIKIDDFGKDKVVLEFRGKGPQNHEMMILLIEKIDSNNFLAIYSPIFAIGEALKISNQFSYYILFFALGLSMILSLIISRKISKPILEISNIAEDISNLNFDKRLNIFRDDEVGDLAKSINKMSDSLRFTIAELKITNERLKLEIQKEKEIDKMRREFISNVNHELKTPIALIKGFTEGLKDNIASPEDRDYYLDVIEDECNNMDILVKKLLVLSKYESEFEIEKREFNIKNILDELLKRYKFDLEKKNLEVDISVADDFLMIGDYKELKIAIDNLFRNAITYSDENSKITIECIKELDRMSFSIKNPYKEMSQEQIEKLWIPFNKEDKARTRKFGGTGLGLSIAGSVFKKHEFQYGATYEQGQIKFYFYDNL